MWFDGICNDCGSDVEETTLDLTDPSEILADYKNRCTNKDCKHHKWHYIGDMEELRYYEHKRAKTYNGD